MAASESRTAFFYGTLMAPAVMHRVCHGNMRADNPIFTSHQCQTRPAILHGYRRQRVRDQDYPAITPHAASSVRGTVVTGLTDADIWRLDIFEGDEYRRDHVGVRPLTAVGDATGRGNIEGEEMQAEVYVWKDDSGESLEPREWDFSEFQRDKMRFWTGPDGEAEYAEVDAAVADAKSSDGTGGRGGNGHIAEALKREHERSQ